MEKFRQVLDECGLFDLGFSGNKFTWSKSYPNGGIVWERLDRAMSLAEWFELFPITKVQTLICVSSNHHPIIILPKGFYGKAQRPWHFEQLWLSRYSGEGLDIGLIGLSHGECHDQDRCMSNFSNAMEQIVHLQCVKIFG